MTDQPKKKDYDLMRSVFIYVMMIITLVMMIGGGVAVAFALVDLIAPPLYYMSYQDFKERYYVVTPDGQKQDTLTVDEEKIRAAYELEKADYYNKHVLDAQRSALRNLAWIIIPLPVFLWMLRMRRAT
ncbi:MAG: hypothetical protein IMX04_03860 [Candidatus Carbobacillus altaicus]|nr:hypothetical protein [Candidatus Carbobacillus altaicus]